MKMLLKSLFILFFSFYSLSFFFLFFSVLFLSFSFHFFFFEDWGSWGAGCFRSSSLFFAFLFSYFFFYFGRLLLRPEIPTHIYFWALYFLPSLVKLLEQVVGVACPCCQMLWISRVFNDCDGDQAVSVVGVDFGRTGN